MYTISINKLINKDIFINYTKCLKKIVYIYVKQMIQNVHY